MAHVQVQGEDVDFDDPVLVEGLPGAGLVGKIAADHLVEEHEMDYYGAVHCDGIPEVSVYRSNSSDLYPPVRLYTDAENDLVVLQSDVPVSASQATGFADCVTEWIQEHDVFPIYLSGLVEEKGNSPELYGVATGDAEHRIDDAGLVPPREGGMITGPTGALLHRAGEIGLDAVGLIVQTEGQFPDPEAARAILEHGVAPIAGIDVDTDALVEQAGEIQEAREQLAKQLQDTDQNQSTRAKPIRGFQ
ncbi:proteasome assembly chaperone family protein [Natronomonas salina]|uniref:proteasome assembly chaperone family protein n=1 Tax=Natronomonas salina TaxID=1710540 RepID=UPI0015B5EDD8|nr:PAC2 family protein [Natronomonas salina]QLD88464.1 proteasome assembly chaperone family protein [Natronomonas salina]